MMSRSILGLLVALSLVCIAFAVPAPQQSAPAEANPSPLVVPDSPPAFDLATKQVGRLTLSPGLSAEVFSAEPQLANPVAMCTDERECAEGNRVTGRAAAFSLRMVSCATDTP